MPPAACRRAALPPASDEREHKDAMMMMSAKMKRKESDAMSVDHYDAEMLSYDASDATRARER